MARARDTHFFTDLGALCGVVPPYQWSMNEARTTCRHCLRLLRRGPRPLPTSFPIAQEEAITRGRSRGR